METPVASRNPSPTDVSDEAWALVAPALSLMTPAAAAQQHGLALEVGKLAAAQRGFVVLPRRWVVEFPIERFGFLDYRLETLEAPTGSFRIVCVVWHVGPLLEDATNERNTAPSTATLTTLYIYVNPCYTAATEMR